MAGKLRTLSQKMVLAALALHAVLLPVLFLSVMAVVERSQEEAFIDDMRIYGRVFADTLESGGTADSDREIIAHLDSALLGGWVVYASLEVDGRTYYSSIMSDEERANFDEDFKFGEHGDGVYYLSLPINYNQHMTALKLGFDEEPTLLQVAQVRDAVLGLLLGYLILALLLVKLLGAAIVRPIRELQRASRKVASGDYTHELRSTSDVFEISALTNDLESMRSNLVGVNARLQEVIEEREQSEARQRTLENKLRHAQRLESIGTLAGGIAHEFNNVLAPIVLYTELALEDLPGNGTVAANLQRVLDLANRARELSKQILLFGRESGDAERVAVDIAPVVEESLSLVRALIPATVDLSSDIQHNLGLVLCDAGQIQQLVINLCSNAFSSLSRGGGRISVSVDAKDVDEQTAEQYPKLRPGSYVLLSVSDTGHGMDQATMERIFEPFFTTREPGHGTGLGLSVVHGIVAKHGGEILVNSTPGSGTVFRIYLPMAGRQQAL